jgi:hypothetical protein
MIINIEKCYKLLLHFIHGFTLNKGNIYVNIVLPHYFKKKHLSVVLLNIWKSYQENMSLFSHIWNQRLLLACTTLLVKKVFFFKYTVSHNTQNLKSSSMFKFGSPRLAQHTFGGIQLWNLNFISSSMPICNCISNQKIFAGYG